MIGMGRLGVCLAAILADASGDAPCKVVRAREKRVVPRAEFDESRIFLHALALHRGRSGERTCHVSSPPLGITDARAVDKHESGHRGDASFFMGSRY